MRQRRRKARSSATAAPQPGGQGGSLPAVPAGEALQDGEERFRVASELTSDFAYTFAVAADGTLVLEWMTEAFARISGYQPREIWPQGNWMSLIHPDDLPLITERLRVVLSGQPDEAEARLINRQGEVRWIRILTRPQWDEAQGRVVRVYGAVQDVTERKLAEEALRATQQQLAAILDSMSEVVAYLDPEQRIVWANRAAGASVGMEPAQMAGRLCYELWGPRGTPCPGCPVLSAVASGRPQEYESVHADGRIWNVRGYPVYGENGEIAGLVDVAEDVTAHRRAEDALRTSEHQYRTTIDSLGDPVHVVDPDLRFVLHNKALQQWIEGLQLGPEVTGRTVFEVFPFLPERVRDEYQQVLDTGKMLITDEETLVGGRTFTTETRKIPVFEDGRVVRIVTVLHDITKRKQAEQALRESEEHYRTVVEDQTELICRFLPDGTITFVNEAYCRYFGRSREELTGQSLWSLIPQEDWPQVQQQISSLSRENPGVTYEDRALLPSGEQNWQQWTNRALFDEQGQLVEYQAVGRDITEHKRAEQVLWQTKMVVEHSPVILYRLRAEEGWPFEFVSENAALLGYAVEDFLSGRVSLTSLVHPDDLPRVLAEMEEYAQRGVDTFRREYRAVVRDGSVHWVEDRVVIVREPDGKVTHYQGILLDVSENKRLEEQFRQAQKMETVGRLAGGVAHDFSNFLTAIRGYAGLAADALPPGDAVRADIEQVLKAAERAASMTGQLLAFSRRQIIEPRPANLNDLVLETEKMVHRLIGEDIELALALAPDLVLVRVDPGQIAQALVNLVVNARDAMPGGGLLSIETANVTLDRAYAEEHPEVTPGPFVMLAVSDTGVGMSAEVKAHLFEPFFTTKEAGRGTGLGLATVYGIIKQHQGHIAVRSEPGQGTTVRIYLPQPKEKVSPTRSRGAAERMPRGEETVLVVEDEPAVRALMVRVLRDLGYQVLAAADGNEAIQTARSFSGPIHLLLTDVVMPQMDGQLLASLLQDAYAGLRVLYVSGYATDVLSRYGVLEQGISLLHKPFTAAALASKVREVLGRAGQGASGEAKER